MRVWDGDGPIWCAQGLRVRLAWIAARDIDGTCPRGHPDPKASGIAARDAKCCNNRMTERVMSDFKITALQIDMQSKKATVILSDPKGGGFVQVAGFPYDRAGEQTETELRRMALDAARAFLQQAAFGNYVG